MNMNAIRFRSFARRPACASYLVFGWLLATGGPLSAQIYLTNYSFGTIAGAAGARGNADGVAAQARFSYPQAVVADSAGAIWVGDNQNAEVRYLSGNMVSTVVTFDPYYFDRLFPAGGLAVVQGAPLYVRNDSLGFYVEGPGGLSITPYQLYGSGSEGAAGLYGMAFDAATNLYIAAALGNIYGPNAGYIEKVTPAPGYATLAQALANGTRTTISPSVALVLPCGVAVDANTNLYVVDYAEHVVVGIDPLGNSWIVAGQYGLAGRADGTAAAASFNHPSGIAVDGLGNLFVADTGNNTIRRITPGPTPTQGTVSTIGGLAGTAGFADGTGVNAHFSSPVGIALDPAGHLFVADTYNSIIREGVTNVTILTQPRSEAAAAGSSPTLGVTAIGMTPLLCQWYQVTATATNAVPGGTNLSLTLTNVQLGNAGSYYCVLTDPVSSATSSNCLLGVVDVQPAQQSVLAGTSASFAVLTAGTPATSCAWYKQGASYLAVFATGPVLAFTPVSTAFLHDDGAYVAVVTTPLGTVTNQAAQLTGLYPPQCVSGPANAELKAGQPIDLLVSVDGTQPLSLQWFLGGAAISGATNSVYSLAAAQLSDAGAYTVVASNAYGVVTSPLATLVVDVPPSITTPPQSQSIPLNSGVTFNVRAAGTRLQYQWSFNGQAILGATSSSYNLASVQGTNGGTYSVLVSNVAGTATSSALLTVLFPPSLTNWAPGLTQGVGYSAAFTVGAAGTPPLAYQWLSNGVPVAGATGTSFVVSPTGTTNAGTYAVVITNLYGTVTGAVNLTVPVYDFRTLANGLPFGNISAVAVSPNGYLYVISGNSVCQVLLGNPGTILPLAGSPVAGNGDGLQDQAFFNSPQALAVDATETIYVADYGNNAVRKITPAGVVTTVATVSSPQGLAVDGAGNLYVSDFNNGAVRKIVNGVVSTFASGLNHPYGVALDGANHVYVSECYGYRVWRFAPSGSGVVIGGTGGSAYRDGPVGSAQFARPTGVAVDAAGNVFVAEGGDNVIRVISSDGSVGTLAGGFNQAGYVNGIGSAVRFSTGASSLAVDPAGNLYTADPNFNSANNDLRIGFSHTPSGPAPLIAIQPVSQSVGAGDSVNLEVIAGGAVPLSYQWTVNGVAIAGATDALLTLSAVQTTDAGTYAVTVTNGSGIVTSSPAVLSVAPGYTWTTLISSLGRINDLAMDTAGNIYVVSYNSAAVQKVVPGNGGWTVVNFAGLPGYSGYADGLGGDARFAGPQGVAVDSLGNVYVSDTGNSVIRKITPGGLVTTLAGNPGHAGYAAGVGTGAQFNQPHGLAVDAAFNVYVTDNQNSLLRMITNGTGGVGAFASFSSPSGVTLDASGDWFVAASGASYIAEISAAGVLSTYAGVPDTYNRGALDGVGSFARFSTPQGAAVDGVGNLYVADTGNHTIRLVTPDRRVRTIGGQAGQPGFADGIGSVARFNTPNAVKVDSHGNVLVADFYNGAIRLGNLPPPSSALPVFLAQPPNQSVTAGYSTVTFSAEAEGPGPLSYRWTFNGSPIPGATNAVLTVTNVLAGNAGLYAVTVSNLNGSITSSNAVLTVAPGFTWTTLATTLVRPQGVAVDAAGNIYSVGYYFDMLQDIVPGGAGWTVVNVAGGVSGYADGLGGDARFGSTQSAAVDSAGNVYVSDPGNQVIRKVTPAGLVTTLAGSPGNAGYANGTNSGARFNQPAGLTVDAAGNVYVADNQNSAIRKITPLGVVTTVGNFQWPNDVAVDGYGNLFVAYAGNAIGEITAAGLTSTYAGGNSGSADGVGQYATFNHCQGVAVDGAGNVYVADYGNDLIRMITPDRTVRTIGGLAGQSGLVDGIGPVARFNNPYALKVDSHGNVLVADFSNGSLRLGSLPPPATSAPVLLAQPRSQSVVAGYSSVVLSAEAQGPGPLSYQWTLNGAPLAWGTNAVLTVTNARVPDAGLYAVTVANANGATSSSNAVLNVQAPYTWNTIVSSLVRINDLAVDTAGNIYVVSYNNGAVQKVMPGNGGWTVSNLAGQPGNPGYADGQGSAAQFAGPQGVAVDRNGNVYVSDTGNAVIRQITPGGLVTTLAGNPGHPGYAAGVGTTAQFNQPHGLAVDAAFNVYVADNQNSAIRKITPLGVATAVGNFQWPNGVAVDGNGNLFVAYAGNAIGEITAAGLTSTYAGGNSGSADGVGGFAQFSGPQGVAVDAGGNLYVADTFNHTIRLIKADRTVSTIGGVAGQSGLVDGAGSTARFNQPAAVKVDPYGNLLVADFYNGAVRLGSPPALAITVQPPSQWVALVGDNLSFTVGVSTPGPLNYQWYCNGVVIPGATSAVLTLPAVAVNQAGSYRVKVSSATASATSNPLALTVQTTTAGALTPPTLIPPSAASGGTSTPSMQITSQALTGGTYEVQVSPDLINWTTVGVYSAPFTFTAAIVQNYVGQFYRVVFLHR